MIIKMAIIAIPIPIPAFAPLLRPSLLTIAGLDVVLGDPVAVGEEGGSMTATEGDEVLPVELELDVTEDVIDETGSEKVLARTEFSETKVTPTGESIPPPFLAVASCAWHATGKEVCEGSSCEIM
jgi:hypothetical protein